MTFTSAMQPRSLRERRGDPVRRNIGDTSPVPLRRGRINVHTRGVQRAYSHIIVGSMAQASLRAGLTLDKGGRPKKPTTIVTETGRIERHIIPLPGTRRVKDLTRADISKVLKDIMAGKTRVSLNGVRLMPNLRFPRPRRRQCLWQLTESLAETVQKTSTLRCDAARPARQLCEYH
jgi:hypothetical protein